MSDPDLIPYLVHACGDEGCEEGCDGVVVFAPSAADAVALGGPWCDEPSCAEARRDDRLEVLRPLWAGKPLRPWGPDPEADRLWRKAGWGELYGPTCNECLLHEWDSVPESRLCLSCDLCAECGHMDDCPEPAGGES